MARAGWACRRRPPGGGVRARRGRPAKRWPVDSYAELAHDGSTARRKPVWVLGGPGEKRARGRDRRAPAPRVRDLTGTDLRNAILALAAADAAVSNDSGLLHVAAAIGTPAIGIFGPTSPWHWAPLNPLAAVIEDRDRAALPALPQAGLPPRASPLHARHPGRTGGWPHAAAQLPVGGASRARLQAGPIRSTRQEPRDRRHLPLPPTTAIGPVPIGP